MPSSRTSPLGFGFEARLKAAAELIRASSRTLVLTGAGLSVESGIAPFRRSAGGMAGLWERFDPMEYGTIDAFLNDPARCWLMLRELGEALGAARPNPGHVALARLEGQGHISRIITQNIDGLHQEAGSRRVIEFHGNWRTMSCLACRSRVSTDTVSLHHLPPLCPCGGVLKPDVIMIGEIIPASLLDAAFEEARSCACLLVVGTSAEMMPAATIPAAAREAGACIIEVNIEETPLSDGVVDLRLNGPAGLVLPRLAQQVDPGREN